MKRAVDALEKKPPPVGPTQWFGRQVIHCTTLQQVSALVHQHDRNLHAHSILTAFQQLSSSFELLADVRTHSLRQQRVELLDLLSGWLQPQINSLGRKQLAQLLACCAKIGYINLSLLQAALDQYCSLGRQNDAQDLAVMLRACAQLAKSEGPAPGHVMQLMKQHDILPRLLGLNTRSQTERMQQVIQNSNTWELSAMLWGVSVLISMDPTLLPQNQATVQHVIHVMSQKAKTASSGHLAMSLFAVGKLAAAGWYAPDKLALGDWGSLVTALAAKGDNISPREVSNALWGLARLSVHGHEVNAEPGCIDQLVKVLGLAPNAVNDQDVSNALWALASMGTKIGSDQVQALVKHLVNSIKQGTRDPQHISTSLWALAELGRAPQGGQGMAQLDNSASSTQPSSVSARALLPSERGVRPITNGQLQMLVDGFVSVIHRASGHTICNAVMALAALAEQDPDHECTARDAVLQILQAFRSKGQQHVSQVLSKGVNGQDLAKLITGCAGLSVLEPHLMHCIVEAVDQHASNQSIPANALVHVIYGLAKLGYPNGQQEAQQFCCLVQHLLQFIRAPKQLSGAEDGNHIDAVLSMACWAIAIADVRHLADAELPLLVKAAVHQLPQYKSAQLSQLSQMHIWLEDCGLPSWLTPQQLQQCKEAWLLETSRQSISSFQQQVYDCAECLGLPGLAAEQTTSDGWFRMDMTAQVEGKQLAIEADGPFHFTNPRRTLDGPVQFRNRALAARGYTVVSIPYFDWNGLTTEQQTQYLRDKIVQACSR